jgi:endo-1,4-beta-mannosidase
VDYSKVRGFDYQPSYASSSFENWLHFDAHIYELELRRGKEHFPKINTIRLWLSWHAYKRDPQKFVKSFEKVLDILDKLGLKAVPILFNRWHDPDLDNLGIYIDHFMPGWCYGYKENLFDSYLEDVAKLFKNDERIMAWDICNEPFLYIGSIEEDESLRFVENAEYAWLKKMYDGLKQLDVRQPLCIGIHSQQGKAGLERVEPISDILTIHPYYHYDVDNTKEKGIYIKLLDDYVEVSKASGKPLLVTETCWGSLDDEWRTENIRFTLSELKKRNLGWIVHALHHSLIPDTHRPEYGPVGWPGNLAFIEADGSLRPGHEVFNKF